MANLTQDDLKKGVLKGTDSADIIEIDANAVTDKKITVKSGNGNDNVNFKNYYYDDLYIYAGMGADTLTAGFGTNHLYGESGTNIFDIGNHQQNTTIYAGKGKVIIDVSSITTIDDDFFAKEDMNNYFKRNGNDLVMYPRKGSGKTTTVTLKDFYKNRGEYILQYEEYDGSKYIQKEYDLRDLRLTTNIEDLKSPNYTGGRLSETIIGDARNNVIKGGDVADAIAGGEGNDTIYGNNGLNALKGDAGNDVIYGGKDTDIINGGAGDDKLYGKQGENQYTYGGGNDTIYLEEGSETILLLNGYDVKNRIKQGNDVLINLKKGDEKGTILLKNFFKIDNVVETITTYKNINQGSLDEIDLFPSDEQYFQASGKGTIKGTAYNDDIYGSEKADKIYAYAGNDSIEAMEGNDKIYAEDSSSTIIFQNGDGNDTIYGGTSNLKFLDANMIDLKYERVKDDLIIKYSENDSVTLSEYFNGYKSNAKKIFGKDNSNDLSTILGYNENRLDYTGGNIKFYSMPKGVNVVNLKGFNEDDLLNSNITKKGNDLVFSNIGSSKNKITVVDYYKNGIDVDIRLNGVDFSEGSLNDVMTIPYTMYYEKFEGTIDNEVVTGRADHDLIKTKDGHDTIEGSSGLDTVYAGSGNDSINYQGYSDFGKKLYGDDGNDTILASNDFDTIYGGKGNDYIQGEAGSDYIYGDADNDYILAGGDFDTVDGGAGNDTIEGGDGKDLLKGGAGNDYIFGDGGVNTIYGGAGDDKLYVNSSELKQDGYELVHGDAGNDEIFVEKGSKSQVYGDAGNDSISVSADATSNEIYGGAGNDTISVDSQYNSIYGDAGNDVITTTASGTDNNIDAGAGNDILNLNASNTPDEGCIVFGGKGNDTYNVYGEFIDMFDVAGNDTYYIDELDNEYYINDSNGKDTLIINHSKDEISLEELYVEVNAKGKISNSKDISVRFSTEDGYINIFEYFGKGTIERIETKDGYYITKEQMDNVAQEVAAWLTSNGFASVEECYDKNPANIGELAFIHENINWQM